MQSSWYRCKQRPPGYEEVQEFARLPWEDESLCTSRVLNTFTVEDLINAPHVPPAPQMGTHASIWAEYEDDSPHGQGCQGYGHAAAVHPRQPFPLPFSPTQDSLSLSAPPVKDLPIQPTRHHATDTAPLWPQQSATRPVPHTGLTSGPDYWPSLAPDTQTLYQDTDTLHKTQLLQPTEATKYMEQEKYHRLQHHTQPLQIPASSLRRPAPTHIYSGHTGGFNNMHLSHTHTHTHTHTYSLDQPVVFSQQRALHTMTSVPHAATLPPYMATPDDLPLKAPSTNLLGDSMLGDSSSGGGSPMPLSAPSTLRHPRFIDAGPDNAMPATHKRQRLPIDYEQEEDCHLFELFLPPLELQQKETVSLDQNRHHDHHHHQQQQHYHHHHHQQHHHHHHHQQHIATNVQYVATRGDFEPLLHRLHIPPLQTTTHLSSTIRHSNQTTTTTTTTGMATTAQFHNDTRSEMPLLPVRCPSTNALPAVIGTTSTRTITPSPGDHLKQTQLPLPVRINNGQSNHATMPFGIATSATNPQQRAPDATTVVSKPVVRLQDAPPSKWPTIRGGSNAPGPPPSGSAGLPKRPSGGQQPRASGKAAGMASGGEPSKLSTCLSDINNEELDLPGTVKPGDLVVDASLPAGLISLREGLQGASAVLLGVLYVASEGGEHQYYCSAQAGLTSEQKKALKKVKRTNNKNSGGRVQAANTDADLPPSAQPYGIGLLCVPRSASTTRQQPNSHPQQSQQQDSLANLSIAGRLAPLFFVPMTSSTDNNINRPDRARPRAEGQKAAMAAVLQLLVSSAQQGSAGTVTLLCADSKGLVRELLRAGLDLPQPVHCLRLNDPCVWSWLEAPTLVHKEEQNAQGRDPLDSYNVEELINHYKLDKGSGKGSKGVVGPDWYGDQKDNRGAAGAAGGSLTASLVSDPLPQLPPMERLRSGLLLSGLLAQHLAPKIKDIPLEAVKLESKISIILGCLEARGVCLAHNVLLSHAASVEARVEELRQEAVKLAGRPDFNPASPQQVADVLYNKLKLPAGAGGKGSAKTHLPTDEATLTKLASLHPLPQIILDYRCLNGHLTKWLKVDWVHEALRDSRRVGLNPPRVFCSWNALNTNTGRVSSNSPNLQAVPKFIVDTTSVTKTSGRPSGSMTTTPAPQSQGINIRAAFAAPAGRVLLSADYNQVELRVLAHMSGDEKLRSLLCEAGDQHDVFKMIATAWLNSTPQQVTPEQREKAKRIVYGIIYGLSAHGLAQQLSSHGVDAKEAADLQRKFLNQFPRVKEFMDSCSRSARKNGYVQTLMGRRRPLPGLKADDGTVRQEAERKVVNSIVQGSAADLIKLSMVQWETWMASTYPSRGDSCAPEPPKLVATIHDELLVECDAGSAVEVAQALANIMSNVCVLSVPLTVKVQGGPDWGTLQPIIN